MVVYVLVLAFGCWFWDFGVADVCCIGFCCFANVCGLGCFPLWFVDSVLLFVGLSGLVVCL